MRSPQKASLMLEAISTSTSASSPFPALCLCSVEGLSLTSFVSELVAYTIIWAYNINLGRLPYTHSPLYTGGNRWPIGVSEWKVANWVSNSILFLHLQLSFLCWSMVIIRWEVFSASSVFTSSVWWETLYHYQYIERFLHCDVETKPDCHKMQILGLLNTLVFKINSCQLNLCGMSVACYMGVLPSTRACTVILI